MAMSLGPTTLFIIQTVNSFGYANIPKICLTITLQAKTILVFYIKN